MKIDKSTLKTLIKEVLQEQTDPRAALMGAVGAALIEIRSLEREENLPLLDELQRKLPELIADKFFFGFEARQKD